MRRRVIIYLLVSFGIILGYFPLSSWLFRPEAVQAQCVQYFLDSHETNSVDCDGATASGAAVLSAYATARYVRLCIKE